MRKITILILSAILSLVTATPSSANPYFDATWSDTNQEAYARTFNKSQYWDSVKNKPKTMPKINVAIDLATYGEGELAHEIWNGTEWLVETSYDLAKLTEANGATQVTVSFPEWIDCGGKPLKFCAGIWYERIALYDVAQELITETRIEVNRYDDPPPFTLSVTGKISAKLGTYYSATVKLSGKKVAKVACEAKLIKQSTSLWPPVLDRKTFTATINKAQVLKFAILTYSDVPQYVWVKCAEKINSVTFAVLK